MLKQLKKECEHNFINLGKYYTVYKSGVTPYKTFLRERFICSKCERIKDNTLEIEGNSITNVKSEKDQSVFEQELRNGGYARDFEMIEKTRQYRLGNTHRLDLKNV